MDGADIEGEGPLVDGRGRRVLGRFDRALDCRARYWRLVDDADFGFGHAVEVLQVVGGVAADSYDAIGGGGAPAGGELKIEALQGGVGVGEVAVADIVQGDDGVREEGPRQEGDDMGGHEEHVGRAAAELPGECAVGPEAFAGQGAYGHGALVVRGRGGAAQRFGGGLLPVRISGS